MHHKLVVSVNIYATKFDALRIGAHNEQGAGYSIATYVLCVSGYHVTVYHASLYICIYTII